MKIQKPTFGRQGEILPHAAQLCQSPVSTPQRGCSALHLPEFCLRTMDGVAPGSRFSWFVAGQHPGKAGLEVKL